MKIIKKTKKLPGIRDSAVTEMPTIESLFHFSLLRGRISTPLVTIDLLR